MRTSIDPEAVCYPSGRMLRRFRAFCPDGKIRAGRCGLPNTWFSIPARLKANGKTVTGFLMQADNLGPNEGEIELCPYKYRKNHTAFGESV